MDQALKQVITIWINKEKSIDCWIPIVVDSKLTTIHLIKPKCNEEDMSNVINISFFDRNKNQHSLKSIKHFEFSDVNTNEEIIDVLFEYINELKKTQILCSTAKCLYPVENKNDKCIQCELENYCKTVKTDTECSICMELNDVLSINLSCHENHVFHYDCLKKLYGRSIEFCDGCGNCSIEFVKIKCPNCREKTKYIEAPYVELKKNFFHKNKSSTFQKLLPFDKINCFDNDDSENDE
jgi:hypothetical protein